MREWYDYCMFLVFWTGRRTGNELGKGNAYGIASHCSVGFGLVSLLHGRCHYLLVSLSCFYLNDLFLR